MIFQTVTEVDYKSENKPALDTPYSQVNYGVFILRIWEEIDLVIVAPYRVCPMKCAQGCGFTSFFFFFHYIKGYQWNLGINLPKALFIVQHHNSSIKKTGQVAMPKTSENWLSLVNSCVYYACQTCEIYQVLSYSVDPLIPCSENVVLLALKDLQTSEMTIKLKSNLYVNIFPNVWHCNNDVTWTS